MNEKHEEKLENLRAFMGSDRLRSLRKENKQAPIMTHNVAIFDHRVVVYTLIGMRLNGRRNGSTSAVE